MQLALQKTGFAEEISQGPFQGGTLFIPNDFAFLKLGSATNAHLFGEEGEKCLRALVEYYFVPNQTLYSNAFYKKNDSSKSDAGPVSLPPAPLAAPATDQKPRFNKGTRSFVLPTYLEEKSLFVDIARYGGLIAKIVNAFNPVYVQDGVASDGVVHVLSSVLVPPRGRTSSCVSFDRVKYISVQVEEESISA